MIRLTFETAQDAFEQLHELILKDGELKAPHGQRTMDMTSVAFQITDPRRRLIHTPERKFSLKAAVAEFLWYMSCDYTVNVIKEYIPRWEQFANPDGTVQSNYGTYWERQVPDIIKLLRSDPMSRQAVLTIYSGEYLRLVGTFKDVPCTETIQFLMHNNELDMVVNMRSNDLWWGFCLDQFSFTLLQELVANELGVNVGSYYHHTGSLHVYERHWEVAISGDRFLPRRSYVPYTYTNFWHEFNTSLHDQNVNGLCRLDNLLMRCVRDGLIHPGSFTGRVKRI